MDAANILSNSLSQSRATLMHQVGKEGEDLDALHRKANNLTRLDNPDELSQKHKELREVSKQYEALFLQQLLSAMDKTIDRSGSLLSGGNTEGMFRDMLNQEMATAASNRPGSQGLGIAEAIYQQMSLVLDGKVHPPSDGLSAPEAVQITGQLHTTLTGTPVNPLSNSDKAQTSQPAKAKLQQAPELEADDNQNPSQHQQQAYLPNELSTIYHATPSTQ